MDWEFSAEVFQWRGPAPYFFVAAPAHVDEFLHAHLGELTYGWGGIPAQVRVGDTEVTTALNSPDIHQVEYIVLTQLQADALVTFDHELATAASAFVKIASLADLLQPAGPGSR